MKGLQKTDSFIIKKSCCRFCPRDGKPVDEENAIVYVKLRQNGCAKKNAINFVSKTVCKTDITKKKDGPVKCKVLDVKNDALEIAHNGWKVFRPKYDLGKGAFSSKKEILVNDYEEHLFKAHFTKHEEKIREDYKNKIEQTRKYFEEINHNTNFSGLNKADLISKIRQQRFRLQTAGGSKRLNDLSQFEFQALPIAFKHLDKDLVDILDVEVGTPRIQEASQTNERHESAQTQSVIEDHVVESQIIQTNNELPSSLIIGTDSANIINSNIKNSNSYRERAKPGLKIEAPTILELAEESKPESLHTATKSMTKELELQAKSLTRLMDESPRGLKIINKRRPSNSEQPDMMRNKNIKNRIISNEFNQVNYIFGGDDKKAENLFSKLLKPTFTSLTKGRSKKGNSLASLSNISTNYPNSVRSKGQSMSKVFDFGVTEDINFDTLKAKQDEMNNVLDKHRRKIKPLDLPNLMEKVNYGKIQTTINMRKSDIIVGFYDPKNSSLYNSKTSLDSMPKVLV